MTTVFIVAGFNIHLSAAHNDYSLLRTGLTAKGYHVVPVDISWLRKTPSQYAIEFKRLYAAHKTEENIVVGNSFGAVIAFMTAPDVRPDRLYLCSLSSFFKEDRGKQPDAYGIKWFGIRRLNDLWALSANDIADEIKRANITTMVTYGEQEHQTAPILVERCRSTAQRLGCELIEIPKAPHSMRDPVYSAALIDLIV